MTFIHRASKSHRRRLMGSYESMILATGPIACWPQSETSGSVAHCLVNPAQNGTYTGVTLANDLTGPFGTPAPYYDGNNDYCNIDTAALVAAFNTDVGTAAIWTRVNAVGVWSDGIQRQAWTVYGNIQNPLWNAKRAVANNSQTYHEGSNVGTVIANAGHTETAWTLWTMTWNTGGNLIAYINGQQDGAPAAGVTAWSSPITTAYIGSHTGAPTSVWHGWLGPLIFWDRVLPPAEIESLYVS